MIYDCVICICLYIFKELIQISLDTHHVWVGEGPSRTLKEVTDKFIYIPVLQVLENLLKCPSVYEEVRMCNYMYIITFCVIHIICILQKVTNSNNLEILYSFSYIRNPCM